MHTVGAKICELSDPPYHLNLVGKVGQKQKIAAKAAIF
jgi:hypothetical protein